MTPAETAAFNAGVEAVLAIAERSASQIAATSKRHVHEEFAVAALAELAEDGRALLLPLDHEPPDPAAPVDPAPKLPAPVAHTAEATR